MMQNVRIGENTLEVRISCYLGGVCKQYGSQRSVWKVFCELLLFLTRRVIFLKARGFVQNACRRSVLLYGFETHALTTIDLSIITRIGNTMIRWTYSTKLQQRISSESQRMSCGIFFIKEIIRPLRLRYISYLTRIKNDLGPKQVLVFVIPGQQPRVQPKMRWMNNVIKNLITLQLKKKSTKSMIGKRSSQESKHASHLQPTRVENCIKTDQYGIKYINKDETLRFYLAHRRAPEAISG